MHQLELNASNMEFVNISFFLSIVSIWNTFVTVIANLLDVDASDDLTWLNIKDFSFIVTFIFAIDFSHGAADEVTVLV